MPLRRRAGPSREAGPASRSLGFGLPTPTFEAAEIACVYCGRGFGRGAIEQEITQALAILIGADELTNIFAAGGVTAFGHLLIDEGFQRIRQRNVHRAHVWKIGVLGKIWQYWPWRAGAQPDGTAGKFLRFSAPMARNNCHQKPQLLTGYAV